MQWCARSPKASSFGPHSRLSVFLDVEAADKEVLVMLQDSASILSDVRAIIAEQLGKDVAEVKDYVT